MALINVGLDDLAKLRHSTGFLPRPYLSALDRPSFETVLEVSNIQVNAGDEIRELFQKFGKIRRFQRQKNGALEIVYAEQSSAEVAKEFYSGVLYEGRPMVIKIHDRPAPVTTIAVDHYVAMDRHEERVKRPRDNRKSFEELDKELEEYMAHRKK